MVATALVITGSGNVNQANLVQGNVIGAPGDTIQGNFIGTDATGTAAAGNSFVGVYLQNLKTNMVIGGTAPGAGNVISANGSDGIYLATPNSTVQGNRVGVGVGGQPVGNVGAGLTTRAPDMRIGGTAAAEANIIAWNGGVGVAVARASQRASILGNSNFSNRGGGISLENTIGSSIAASTYRVELFSDLVCSRQGRTWSVPPPSPPTPVTATRPTAATAASARSRSPFPAARPSSPPPLPIAPATPRRSHPARPTT